MSCQYPNQLRLLFGRKSVEAQETVRFKEKANSHRLKTDRIAGTPPKGEVYFTAYCRLW